MSLENFTPQLWADAILLNYNDKHVYVESCNRDYEGDIREQGDSVKINSIGRITIAAHTKNTDINAPETLDGAQQVLVIDQANYFNAQVDDVDKVQNKPKVMGAFTKEAAWGLADAADVDVATALQAGVAGIGGGAGTGSWLADRALGVVPGTEDAYEALVDLGTKLDDNNVPVSGRWVIVPNAFHGLLLKDPRFVSFGTDKNRGTLTNGMIGEAAGFTIKKSNNVPVSSGEYTVIAGHKEAVTFADQIPPGKVEAFRPERRFADAIKGLHLYGLKVTRPYGLARIDVTFP
jgi:hypothetical protein